MILQPAVLALLGSSLLTSFMVLYAAGYGVKILAGWDLRSGSETQLRLERQTSLVSTMLAYALVVQLLSLFFFIATADRLHVLFTGAMCAAGTLNVNGFGYPVLVLKIVDFLMAGVWLVVNHADTRGYDYPLIRFKYACLVVLAPLIVLEAVLQYGFFANLQANVITSCCGSLFSPEGGGIASEMASLPARPSMTFCFLSIAATVAAGAYFFRKGKGGTLFSLVSTVAFGAALAALVSGFCLYIYELPTHHCPFCILQKEYGYVGYVLYAALLGGAVAGLSVGVLTPFRSRGSMAAVIPPLQRTLVATAVILYVVFAAVVSLRIYWSPFRLGP
jgi:hypothetical protein